MIFPTESIYDIPTYSAKMTLLTPTKEADPSFIEFFASRFKNIKLYFLAIFRPLNALCKETIPATKRVAKVISGLFVSIDAKSFHMLDMLNFLKYESINIIP